MKMPDPNAIDVPYDDHVPHDGPEQEREAPTDTPTPEEEEGG